MALITCDDCGRSISDRALACPNCGAPMSGQNRTPVIIPGIPDKPTIPSAWSTAKAAPIRSETVGQGELHKGFGALILFAVAVTLTATSAALRNEPLDVAFQLGGSLVPFVIGLLVLWKKSLTAALVTVVVVVALTYYGSAAQKKPALSPAGTRALTQIEGAYRTRQAELLANSAEPASPATPIAPSATDKGTAETTDASENGVIARAAHVIATFQPKFKEAENSFVNDLQSIQFELVLTPERLTTQSGIELDRVALTKASASFEKYRQTQTKLTAEYDKKLQEAAAGPYYEGFMGGFRKSVSARDQLSSKVFNNQWELIAAASDIVEFMADELGRTSLEGQQIVFETDAKAERYNKLTKAFIDLAAEEERLRQELAKSLETGIKTLQKIQQTGL